MSLTHKNLSVNDSIYVVRNKMNAKIVSKYTDGIVVRYDGQEHLEFFQHIQNIYYSLEDGKYVKILENNMAELKNSYPYNR